MKPPKLRTQLPVVFDSEAVSRSVRGDAYLRTRLRIARDVGLPVVISAATLVEVSYPKIDRAALSWVRSYLDIVPVSEFIADEASQLLAHAGLHGHKHAIDAMVSATALALGSRPIIFTSDPKDIALLTDGRASVFPLR